MELRYICAQPATKYYAWQVEVMIVNFMAMGVNPNQMDIVCVNENGVPAEWQRMTMRYPCRFFFYTDQRETKHYISSKRPNVLKQHFAAHPELKDEVIFYHDCDIIFSKPPTEWILPEMLEDFKWYGSDTRGYISHSYIVSKGQEVMDKMCEIMRVPERLIKDNELNCIGAQYLMKHVTASFWEQVEKDSEILYKQMTALNNKLIPIENAKWEVRKKEWDNPDKPFAEPKYNPLQIWCADMWAVLWGAWRMGFETQTHPNFDFSWGTSDAKTYDEKNIMHNAGVTDAAGGLFYKCAYITESPYWKHLTINENTASKKYYEWVQKTERLSVL